MLTPTCSLTDQKTPLDLSLTTRSIAKVNWTADTAFVHPVDAKYPALPVLIRHFRKANDVYVARHAPHKKHAKGLQMKLLA
jgi:hypothetical protein